MENASKALLIAAGIFLILLILSLVVLTYNRISSFYQQKHEATVIEQAREFNDKFEGFHRNDIRGTELLSLMNRVIDYNSTQSYFEDKDYERIKVTITLGGNDILERFNGGGTGGNKYLTSEITNVSAVGDNWSNDKNLVAITNTPSELCEKAKEYKIDNMTDTKLQLLASNLSNIMADDSADDRIYRANKLQNILGIELSIDANGKSENEDTKKIIKGAKELASQYYQYMQFKRAYFDCTEVKYDEDTGRVVEMNFKLQIKNGEVVFN